MSLQEYNIGYNVETTAERWGNAQTSPFGNAVRAGFAPYSGVNYEWFPYDPYYTPDDFFGVQRVVVPPPEYLYGQYWGYRGILPLELQNVSPEPYPYQVLYPFNQSA